MSVAGILGSSLFSNIGSQMAQQSPSTANFSSAAQSAFAALQQKMSASSSSSTAGASSLPAQLTQIGQDLKSGNLSAAQSDFSTFKMTLAQDTSSVLHRFQTGSAASGGSSALTASSGISGQSGAGTDPLAAAMLAYSSLQQNPTNGALSSSLMTPASTFAVNA